MRIAIIGAGLAGLTAAHRLKQKGLSVDLFEARNRVGGRVFSALMKNSDGHFSVIELGGQSILDGGEATHFLSLCKEFNLEIESREVPLNSEIYYEGKYYNFDKELCRFFQENPNALDEIEKHSEKCASLQELIDKFFMNYPALRVGLISRIHAYEGLDPSDQSIYHNFETFKCTLEGGISKAHNTYERDQGNIIIKSIAGGNAQLAIELAKTLGKNLHLNKTLTRIEKEGSQFHLFFSDDSMHICDRVILATPATVYKNIELSKTIAVHDRWEKMQSLSYGQNFKLFIPIDVTEPGKYVLIRKDYISLFAGSKNTLILYGSRPIADLQKELDIISEAFKLSRIDANTLVKAKGENFAEYSSPVVHIWEEDVYAKGSYSAYSTTLSKELDESSDFAGEIFKTLFRPTTDGLFFAGEHTSLLDCIGTMEAAAESGERVARALSPVRN